MERKGSRSGDCGRFLFRMMHSAGNQGYSKPQNRERLVFAESIDGITDNTEVIGCTISFEHGHL
jgi:hypothetical protein